MAQLAPSSSIVTLLLDLAEQLLTIVGLPRAATLIGACVGAASREGRPLRRSTSIVDASISEALLDMLPRCSRYSATVAGWPDREVTDDPQVELVVAEAHRPPD